MKDYRDHIDPWVFDLLATHRNAVIRNATVEYYGIDYLSELLTDIMGEPVTVTESDNYEVEGQTKIVKKGKLYIAWMNG